MALQDLRLVAVLVVEKAVDIAARCDIHSSEGRGRVRLMGRRKSNGDDGEGSWRTQRPSTVRVESRRLKRTVYVVELTKTECEKTLF